MLKINCINTISPVVSALVSRSIAPGTSPGLADHRDIVLCSCRARHFTLTVPLSTQVCKRVLSNLKKLILQEFLGQILLESDRLDIGWPLKCEEKNNKVHFFNFQIMILCRPHQANKKSVIHTFSLVDIRPVA